MERWDGKNLMKLIKKHRVPYLGRNSLRHQHMLREPSWKASLQEKPLIPGRHQAEHEPTELCGHAVKAANGILGCIKQSISSRVRRGDGSALLSNHEAAPGVLGSPPHAYWTEFNGGPPRSPRTWRTTPMKTDWECLTWRKESSGRSYSVHEYLKDAKRKDPSW